MDWFRLAAGRRLPVRGNLHSRHDLVWNRSRWVNKKTGALTPEHLSCAPVTVLLFPCPFRLNQATTRLLPHKIRAHACRASAVQLLAISTLNRLTGFFSA